MNQKQIVREYDTIICNPKYAESERYVYIDPKHFQALSVFIREFAAGKEETDILNFLRIGYRRGVGDTISFNSYVGVIQLKDGFQLEILPKIDLTADEKIINTKRIFLKMLRSLDHITNKIFTEANLQVEKMNLYEIFIQMYISEATQLVKKGIKSAYVQQEDNLNCFKGKLNIQKQLQINQAHQEKFYVSYEDFLPDIPENKLIKTTLIKLKSITNSQKSVKQIYQLLSYFEMVNVSTNYEKDFSSITITRMNQDYKILLEWSRVFLMNKSFSAFSGDTNSRAILFPMETVYESYVAKQMKKLFSPSGWNVSAQDAKYYLVENPKKQFALRPDLVLRKENQIIIMDTKWKKVDPSKTNYN